MNSFVGQTALVTGASSGIGRAVALALAAGGATVYAVGRDSARLEGVVRAIAGRGARAFVLRADLSDDADLARIVETIQTQRGGLDLLVHAAGVFRMAPFDATSPAEFDELFRVNVRAPWRLTQAMLPLLKAARGQIVFVNSSAALNAAPRWSAYAASKSALKSLADSLRAEVNAAGVRVISIFPGRTASPMQEAIHALEGRAYEPGRLMQPDDVASMLVAALNLPRTAETTDLFVRPMQKG